MGKGAAKHSEALQSQAADRYTKLAQEQYDLAKPAQQQAFNYYGGIVKGGPEAYRVAAPEVNFMKRQFANAESQVRDHLPAGGQKTRAYRDLAVSQPGAISAVFQKKIEGALAQLASLGQAGVGNTLNATTGVQTSANQLGQLAAARGAAVSGAISGLAGIAGTAFGGGFGGGGATPPVIQNAVPQSPLSSYANTSRLLQSNQV